MVALEKSTRITIAETHRFAHVAAMSNTPPTGKLAGVAVLLVIGAIVIAVLAPFTTIPAGHVGVVSLFGKVDTEELPAGFHIINPLAKVNKIDCRNQEETFDDLGVPSQDQLSTEVDLTVKWRVNPEYAAEAFKETGDASKLKTVHLLPKVRSLTREAGKSVVRAEDFYNNETQSRMQTEIQLGLQNLAQKGILVDDVLMRRVDLPRTIIEGVHAKKRQEQKAEQQKAEFDRFKTEQQQKIAQAEAEKAASEQEALQRRLLADAKAYEIVTEATARAESIKIEGEALRESPDLIRLRAVEKWNGTVPRVTLGDQMIPMINLSEETKEQ